MIDGHMHTPLCKHAQGDPSEYAQAALQAGLSAITFTCHSPMPNDWWPEVRMADDQWDTYVDLIARTSLRFAGQLEVRLGLESDWFPGMEPWLERLHQRAPLHHVLGSVHFFGRDYLDRFFTGNVRAFQAQYFSHLAESAETGLFDTLAHPDLVKNFRPDEWSLSAIQEEVEAALDRIAKTGVAMEVNTSGLHKRLREMNPGRSILELMHSRNIPVVIGSDAHTPTRVAADFDAALDLVESAGYTDIHYFVDRTQHQLPIAHARARLVPHPFEASSSQPSVQSTGLLKFP
jgi:histidinol-phosphatase (PHP family)